MTQWPVPPTQLHVVIEYQVYLVGRQQHRERGRESDWHLQLSEEEPGETGESQDAPNQPNTPITDWATYAHHTSGPLQIEHGEKHDPQQIDHVPIGATCLHPPQSLCLGNRSAGPRNKHKDYTHTDYEMQEMYPGKRKIIREEFVGCEGYSPFNFLPPLERLRHSKQ
jgi:hypothetical protein